jgi:hypothetical protein
MNRLPVGKLLRPESIEARSPPDSGEPQMHAGFRLRASKVADARRVQIARSAVEAYLRLANVADIFRRLLEMKPPTATPEINRIALDVADLLIQAGPKLRRWSAGGIPTPAEIEEVNICLGMAQEALMNFKRPSNDRATAGPVDCSKISPAIRAR